MNLTDPGTLQRLLARHGFKADKSLGQHFLISEKVVDSIVGEVRGFASVLEIGPGPGVLTQRLNQSVETVWAIEIDPRMIAILGETSPNVRVLQLDALGANLTSILSELPEPRAVVSNLPYYITGPLLDRIYVARASWSKAVLMMQREVGEKVLARVGERRRGALSVVSQALFCVEKVCNVPPGAFLPPPKVDSVVLRFSPLEADFDKGFFEFVHTGFTQPRKTLANNLKPLGVTPESVAQAGLKELVRPHEISLEDWLRLWEIRKS